MCPITQAQTWLSDFEWHGSRQVLVLYLSGHHPPQLPRYLSDFMYSWTECYLITIIIATFMNWCNFSARTTNNNHKSSTTVQPTTYRVPQQQQQLSSLYRYRDQKPPNGTRYIIAAIKLDTSHLWPTFNIFLGDHTKSLFATLQDTTHDQENSSAVQVKCASMSPKTWSSECMLGSVVVIVVSDGFPEPVLITIIISIYFVHNI